MGLLFKNANKNMIFSLIIVNYNTKELLKNCLKSVFRHYSVNEVEIIVVDNNSGDGSVEMVKNNFGQRIKLIVNKKNIGFGPANNQGTEAAGGEFLFFLNSDTIIKEDIFTPFKKIFSTQPRLGIVAPRLLLPNGQPQPYAFGQFPSLSKLLWGKVGFSQQTDWLADKDLYFVDWVSGAAMMVRRNIFNQIGGFDENFFMYFEDIDLCWRIKQRGWQVTVCPKVSLIHFVGQSAGGFKQRKKYYYQSQDYFFKKHYKQTAMYILKTLRWPYRKILRV
jgi:GT2 family glycosyltransferase